MSVADLLQTKPSDMMMSLYLRAIHPEFFRIFAWRSFKTRHYEAELWITGLSHVLTVRQAAGRHSAERCVTEVIGPSHMALPPRGKVQAIPLAGEDEASFALRNGFQYQISFQTETLKDAEVFAALYEDLRHQSHKEGLACEFRTEGVERALWPMALIIPTYTREGFLLYAFHVFPDHQAVLKTQTLIEITGRGDR
jgi:hypothetical protein